MDVWLTWSLSGCLLWVTGGKREGHASFVAKTIEVMVRLAPSHRGAPGKGRRHCARGISCAVFRPAHPACTHAKQTLFITHAAPIMTSVNLHR